MRSHPDWTGKQRRMAESFLSLAILTLQKHTVTMSVPPLLVLNVPSSVAYSFYFYSSSSLLSK